MQNFSVWGLAGVMTLALMACSESKGATTAIAVSIKTDLKRGSEIEAVRLRVYRLTDQRLTQPVDDFALEATELSRPVVVKQGEDDGFLLAVQALGPGGKSDARVEYRVRAAFQAGETRALHVFLARACLDRQCGDGETCYGESRDEGCEGSCGPIPGPDQLNKVVRAGDEARWEAGRCGSEAGAQEAGVEAGPSPDAGDAGTRCVPSVPNARCNLVTQCGCDAGESCAIASITNGRASLECRAPVDPVLPGGFCGTNQECSKGHHCIGLFCRPYCNADADCGGGTSALCNGISNADVAVDGVSVCAPTCSADEDCAPGQFCRHDGLCVPLFSLSTGETCTDSAQCDGNATDDALCVSTRNHGRVCEPAGCKVNDECPSRCCRMMTDGMKTCYPEDECDGGSSCPTGTLAGYSACTQNSECCGYAAGTHLCLGSDLAGRVCSQLCTSTTASSLCSWSSTKCCATFNYNDGGVGGGFCAPDQQCE